MRKMPAALLVVLALGASFASADDPNDGARPDRDARRFVLGLEWAYVDFSTTYEWVDAGSGNRAFISLEGDLGLPASQSVPALSLLARVGRRSYIAANVGRFRRSTTLLELEEELVLDDLVIEVGGEVDLFFNVTDIDVSYGHAWVDDERVRIIGKLGASLLDLDLGLEAVGEYRIGEVTGSGEFRLDTSLLVPVPLVGFTFDVNLAKGWVLTSAVDFFYLPVSDITANAWRAQILVRYEFSRTVGVVFGYGTFDIEVVEKTERAKSTISYTMNGFAAGLVFAF